MMRHHDECKSQRRLLLAGTPSNLSQGSRRAGYLIDQVTCLVDCAFFALFVIG